MSSNSILRKLQIYMLGFGILMGIVFPIYANFFVHFKEGMFWFFVVGCLMAGVTVGLVSFLFVKIILLKKLKQVSDVASSVEDKNLSNLVNFNSNDDVGLIVNGLNSAILNIRNLFIEMTKVFAISENALSTVNNNDRSNQSALEKINHAILGVTQNTQQIELHSENISESVKKGKQISECTLENQKGTINQVSDFSKIMDSLVSHSDKINGILSIIKDIAGQTNILSLNASVEAARAGEFGKGFAVVAGEIQKLAASTTDSSQTIAHAVKLIQNEINRANGKIDQLSNGVKKNNADVLAINNQFSNIDNAIHSNINHNRMLSSSVTQLNDLFSEVHNVFDELNTNLLQLQTIVADYKY